MRTITLPPLLQTRLDALPQGLRAHIQRVREIARELAAAHNLDQELAELTAAAHDVARAAKPQLLLDEAQRMALPINVAEANAPILLHGPVGARWLSDEGAISDATVLEGVRWHTTSHPELSSVGKVVFLADKLDPTKAAQFPFQESVRTAAFEDLCGGVLTFLDGALAQHIERGELIHPTAAETRNAMLIAGAC
jgi:predicted HD superfamily hydrolase involved in NAD metabolism